MERSIVMFGNASWCVTLPKTWTSKYGVKKGDKVDVKEEGNSLIIKAGKYIAPSEAILDLEGMDTNLIEKIIAGYYKKGHDSIQVKCYNEKQYHEIEKVLSRKRLGIFEKTDELSNENKAFPLSIVLVISSSINESNLNEQITAILKELYRLNDELMQLWQKKQWQDIKELMQRDGYINDIADICRRIINLNPKDSTSASLYQLVVALEQMGDSYKHIFEIISSEKLLPSNFRIQAFTQTGELLLSMFNLFKKFNLTQMQEISQNGKNQEVLDLGNSLLNVEYFSLNKKMVESLSALLVAHI